MFSLCEVSEYLWNSFVYLGKNYNPTEDEINYERELGKSGAVVPKLMSSLYNQGYHLYIDNWYTSEKLFRHLESEGTVAWGTPMGHRLKIPESLKEERLEKGKFFNNKLIALNDLFNRSSLSLIEDIKMISGFQNV